MYRPGAVSGRPAGTGLVSGDVAGGAARVQGDGHVQGEVEAGLCAVVLADPGLGARRALVTGYFFNKEMHIRSAYRKIRFRYTANRFSSRAAFPPAGGCGASRLARLRRSGQRGANSFGLPLKNDRNAIPPTSLTCLTDGYTASQAFDMRCDRLMRRVRPA